MNKFFRFCLLLPVCLLTLTSCGEESFLLISSDDKETNISVLKENQSELTDLSELKISISAKESTVYRKSSSASSISSGTLEKYYKVSNCIFSFYSRKYIDADNYLSKAIVYDKESDSYFLVYEGKSKVSYSTATATNIINKTCKGKRVLTSEESAAIGDKIISNSASEEEVTEFILNLTPYTISSDLSESDVYLGTSGTIKIVERAGSAIISSFFDPKGTVTEVDSDYTSDVDTYTRNVNIRSFYSYACSVPSVVLAGYELTEDDTDLNLVESGLTVLMAYL